MRDKEHIDILKELAEGIRNITIDTAAQVAALYGAPPEAVNAIFRMKGIGEASSVPTHRDEPSSAQTAVVP